MAFSGLGTSHALAFIQTADPSDLKNAQKHLEHALDLDSELGEPYPWLCNIYSRMGQTEQSLAMGEKGVKLQPDLALAHYFFSGTLVVAIETGLGSYQKGMDGLTRALMLEPDKGTPWMVAGLGALMTGHYSAAQWLFEGASPIEKSANPRLRFVGASTMLGFLHGRQLAWEESRRCHDQSIALLRPTQHVYRDTFITLSACGLGEINLRNQQPQQALTHCRHAWPRRHRK